MGNPLSRDILRRHDNRHGAHHRGDRDAVRGCLAKRLVAARGASELLGTPEFRIWPFSRLPGRNRRPSFRDRTALDSAMKVRAWGEGSWEGFGHAPTRQTV